MSVIGRLDEQVDEVLIKPLSQKGERDAAPTDAPARTLATPQADAEPPADDDDVHGPQPPRRELPVWLL